MVIYKWNSQSMAIHTFCWPYAQKIFSKLYCCIYSFTITQKGLTRTKVFPHWRIHKDLTKHYICIMFFFLRVSIIFIGYISLVFNLFSGMWWQNNSCARPVSDRPMSFKHAITKHVLFPSDFMLFAFVFTRCFSRTQMPSFLTLINVLHLNCTPKYDNIPSGKLT